MNKNRYTKLFDRIKADDDAVRNAVDSIYEKETTDVDEFKLKRSMNLKFVHAVAVALVFVLVLGVYSLPITPKADNCFVVKAGASEINSIGSVEIGELKGENNAIRICFDDSDKVSYLAQCKVVNFPVMCMGDNIEKVTYKVKGNGYFALHRDVQGVSDVKYVEKAPTSYEEEQKYPYDLADTGDYTKKALAYTVDYDAQNEAVAKLCLYTVDDGDKYCDSYSETIYFEKSDGSFVHGKDFDYEMMYLDIFTDGKYSVDAINYSDYSVEITATFEDGTQESKTVNLGLEKTKKNYDSGEDGEYTVLNVHAKLSE